MALKILIIVDGMLSGGAERQIIELLKGLKNDARFSMALCVLSDGGEREREALDLADSTLPVSAAGTAGIHLLLKFPVLLLQVLNACRRSRPDVIHTYGCFADLLGTFLSKLQAIPFINGSIRAARPRLHHRDRISQLTFPFADMIVANSSAGLRSFSLRRKGVVIHNGVDPSRFSNVSSVEITGAPVLCMVGNFTDKKDQKRLISCLPKLKNTFEDIRLVLVGRGKKISECKAYSAHLGCREQVVFVDDCDNPEPYIAAADICLLISHIEIHGEGISNAIIEYMAMGKPVIASDCGGNSELVIDGVTGLLIRNNDAEKLTDAITELLADGVRCAQMAQEARRRIENEFSLERMIQSYTRLYLDVAANRT